MYISTYLRTYTCKYVYTLCHLIREKISTEWKFRTVIFIQRSLFKQQLGSYLVQYKSYLYSSNRGLPQLLMFTRIELTTVRQREKRRVTNWIQCRNIFIYAKALNNQRLPTLTLMSVREAKECVRPVCPAVCESWMSATVYNRTKMSATWCYRKRRKLL